MHVLSSRGLQRLELTLARGTDGQLAGSVWCTLNDGAGVSTPFALSATEETHQRLTRAASAIAASHHMARVREAFAWIRHDVILVQRAFREHHARLHLASRPVKRG